jgi:hypothetical protein
VGEQREVEPKILTGGSNRPAQLSPATLKREHYACWRSDEHDSRPNGQLGFPLHQNFHHLYRVTYCDVSPIPRKHFQLPSGSFFNTISTVPRI